MNKLIEDSSQRFKAGDHVVAFSHPHGLVYGKVLRVRPGILAESQLLYVLGLDGVYLVIAGRYCHLLTSELVEEMKKNEIDELNKKWDRIKNMIENS